MIAADAGDRRAPGQVIVGKAFNHFLAEGAFMVEHVMGNAQPVGHGAGIADVVAGAAGPLAPGGRAIIVQLQGSAATTEESTPPDMATTTRVCATGLRRPRLPVAGRPASLLFRSKIRLMIVGPDRQGRAR